MEPIQIEEVRIPLSLAIEEVYPQEDETEVEETEEETTEVILENYVYA